MARTAPRGSIWVYTGDVMRLMEVGYNRARELIISCNDYIEFKLKKRRPPRGRTYKRRFYEYYGIEMAK